MTLLKTLTALAQSAIELPNALHACVEMAREAEYFRRLDASQYNLTTNAAETTRLRACNDNLTGHCNVLTEEKNKAIADKIAATSSRDRAESKLATVEAELANVSVRLHNATGRANEATDALGEWQGWAMSKASSIACSADVELRDLIDQTISDAEAELSQCKADLQIARELSTKHIVEAQDNFEKLAIVAEELNRERESRRWRKVIDGCGDIPPEDIIVLWQANHPHHELGAPSLGLQGPSCTYRWRYLSPEDMP